MRVQNRDPGLLEDGGDLVMEGMFVFAAMTNERGTGKIWEQAEVLAAVRVN